MALEQSLESLSNNHHSNFIVEADSEITINAAKITSGGSKPDKVSNHWKLIQVYQRIQMHLRGLRTISFNHVRGDANKMVDLLANQGVNSVVGGMAKKWQEIPPSRAKAIWEEQAKEDREVAQYHAEWNPMM